MNNIFSKLKHKKIKEIVIGSPGTGMVRRYVKPNLEVMETYDVYMTNADRIRQMTDDELQKVLLCPYDTAGADIDIMPCVKETGTLEFVSSEYCKACMLKWLQKEVEDTLN